MSRKVPGVGPKDADVMIIGEAPGGEEAAKGEPFVGKSGQLLTRYLQSHGVQRDEVYLTNLNKYRPRRGNQFSSIPKAELEEGLSELEDEINEVDPNVIIALGGYPLYHLTGQSGQSAGSGITTWRGSILPTTERWGKTRKVIPTLHPSYVLRVWDQNPIFHYDLGKALKDRHFPELNYPEYESIIDPDPDDLLLLVDECKKSDWVSVDIETFPNGTFSCIGFTPREDIGICITFQRPDLHHYVREVWEHECPKIFQYGTYDISFMRFFYGWEVGGYHEGRGWDTYVASASIFPSFKRSLDFLASIYTRFPYYKEERKVWKQENDMTILWEYNIKDIIATYQIAMEQQKDIKELF